jgi:cell division GTPase FtsZ
MMGTGRPRATSGIDRRRGGDRQSADRRRVDEGAKAAHLDHRRTRPHLYEVDEAATRIREEVDQDANIIVGATFEGLDGIIRVSVVATGIDTAVAQRPPVAAAESRIAEVAQRLRASETRASASPSSGPRRSSPPRPRRRRLRSTTRSSRPRPRSSRRSCRRGPAKR